MISVIVLTHNNESTIVRTLDSLTWCDEIIVVDDISTDRTIDLAKKYGAVIVSHQLEANFALQRNRGLQKAKGEWVLYVDSDEIVPPGLQKEILNAVRSATNNTGYYISRKDILFGRELHHGETASVKLLRLAKKGCGDWKRAIHEIWEIQGAKGRFATPLLHYSHKTVQGFLSDINLYSSINAGVFYEEGKRATIWQIIAYPVGKFIRNYIFLGGFLDGVPGFIMAMMMSFHSFLTRGKMWELHRT